MKRAWCPGSMGELVQGTWEGKEVLISLTIDRFSEIEVDLVERVDPKSREHMQELWKSKRAMELILQEWGLSRIAGKIVFRRCRSIPEGKGYASSTADIAALIAALALLVERDLYEEDIARIALKIEPSDGIVFSKMCIFDHLDGSILVRFPVPRYLGVVGVELPGVLDTLSVDRRRMRAQWEKYQKDLSEAFGYAQRGLEENDLSLLGRAATLSSWIAQSFFPEPIYEKLIEICSSIGGLGINRAHTGKAFGILFDTRVYPPKKMLQRVKEALRNEKADVFYNKVISGGARVMNL
jgi:L-threonine kinase